MNMILYTDVLKYLIVLFPLLFYIQIKGSETLSDLLGVLSMCHEYSDVPLRAGEKRCLNLLNRRPRGQAAEGAAGACRFPLPGRIQTRDMKVNW